MFNRHRLRRGTNRWHWINRPVFTKMTSKRSKISTIRALRREHSSNGRIFRMREGQSLPAMTTSWSKTPIKKSKMWSTQVVKSKRLAPSSKKWSKGERADNQLQHRPIWTWTLSAIRTTSIIWSKPVNSRKTSWRSAWTCARTRIQPSSTHRMHGACQVQNVSLRETSIRRQSRSWMRPTSRSPINLRTNMQRKMQAKSCIWYALTMYMRILAGWPTYVAIAPLANQV